MLLREYVSQKLGMTLYLAIHLLNAVLSLLSRCELDKTHLLAPSRMISEDGAGLNVTKTLQEAMPIHIVPSQTIALMSIEHRWFFLYLRSGRQDSENFYESVCGCILYNQRHIIGTLLLSKACTNLHAEKHHAWSLTKHWACTGIGFSAEFVTMLILVTIVTI